MNELRLDDVMKKIDVYGRVAFGAQCAAAMAMIAGPLVFVGACVLPFLLWGDDHGEAIVAWIAGWALGIGTGAGGLGIAVFAWRWSGDWITEWPGYAVGFGIAAAADALLAYLLFSTDVPAWRWGSAWPPAGSAPRCSRGGGPATGSRSGLATPSASA